MIKEKDIQIVMDTKILQQILKTFPENMQNQINVIMVNQVNNGNGVEKEIDILEWFEKLKEPRLLNFKKLIVRLALEKFRTYENVGKFLGIDRKTVPAYIKDMEGKEIEEEV